MSAPSAADLAAEDAAADLAAAAQTPAARARARAAADAALAASCPYLSTVNRRALDFDREKACSVTLSTANVYACLVCGLYFAGRGRSTPAAAHAAAAGHFVWVGVTPPEGGAAGEAAADWTPRFWCLPDGYEVRDASLRDVAAALRPRFSRADLCALDAGDAALAADAAGAPFLPGYPGVLNLGRTDGVAAVALALAHAKPLRDYFLAEPPPYARARAPLVHAFGDLLRRVWARAALRASVSPAAFVNAVSEASARRYGAGAPVDAAEFLAWLLNALHTALVDARAPVRAADAPREIDLGALAPGPGPGAKRARDAAAAAPPAARGPAFAGGESIISHVFAGLVEVTLLSSDLEEEKTREAAAARAAAARRAARAGGAGGARIREPTG